MLCDPIEDKTELEGEILPLDLPEGVPPLTTFYLYLTTGCNLACSHCWITPTFVNSEPQPGDCIDLELLHAAIQEAKPLGLRSAKLTGGEPTLHPEFVKIVDLLTDEGLDLNMETNGTLVDPPLALYLREQTNLSFISVSLDGACAETHDSFRNVPGSFQAALNGLDNLVAAGFDNIQVIMSPHRGNISEVDDLVALAVDHGAGSVKFNPVSRIGRGITMHERGQTLDYDEVMALIRYVRGDLQDRSPISMILSTPPALSTISDLLRGLDGAGQCHVLNILGLLGSGEMALCGIGRNVPDLCFGILGQDSLRGIWLAHPVLIQLRKDLADPTTYPGVCGNCLHASRCLTHCVANNYVESGHLVWPSDMCAEADRRGSFPETRRRFIEK